MICPECLLSRDRERKTSTRRTHVCLHVLTGPRKSMSSCLICPIRLSLAIRERYSLSLNSINSPCISATWKKTSTDDKLLAKSQWDSLLKGLPGSCLEKACRKCHIFKASWIWVLTLRCGSVWLASSSCSLKPLPHLPGDSSAVTYGNWHRHGGSFLPAVHHSQSFVYGNLMSGCIWVSCLVPDRHIVSLFDKSVLVAGPHLARQTSMN